MLTLWGDKQRSCDGMSRRNFLRVGALGLGGLSLADVLRARSQAAEKPKARAVIMVCLPGGPSHIDTFDPKPDAPEDYRGEFKPIRTNVPGFDVTEMLPLQTQIADKMALVRTVQFKEPMQHELHEVYTGFTLADSRPSFGSAICRNRGEGDRRLPRYVSLDYNSGGFRPFEHPRYIGSAYGPFHYSSYHGGVANLRPANGTTVTRIADRRTLLGELDGLRRDIDTQGKFATLDNFTAQAFDMITTPKAREAFDLNREPDRVKQRYGLGGRDKFHYAGNDLHWDGSKFLLARRLVEAGVPVVTLQIGSWDHHGNVLQGKSIWYNLRSELPLMDRSIHALITDLQERGLSDEVLVLIWGEFGRTPKISQAGRDHWPDAGFALFSGGGVKTGQVIGETDSRGARPKNRPLGPQNVLATVYQTLGVDPAQTLIDGSGRPVPLLDDPTAISELF